eukprot:3225146-Pyramimonas_sp.AAC.1
MSSSARVAAVASGGNSGGPDGPDKRGITWCASSARPEPSAASVGGASPSRSWPSPSSPRPPPAPWGAAAGFLLELSKDTGHAQLSS